MGVEPTPCACTTLRKASRAVTRFYDEALRTTRFTTTQFAVMRAVSREGNVPMSRVAEALVMDRTSLYRAVAPLLRGKDLELAPSPEDGRAKVLRVTESGKRRMARAARKWASAQQRMVETMGIDRWRELSQWLEQTAEDALALAHELPKGGRQ